MNKLHIVHITYRLDTGGLENGMVNLINHLPSDQYQHTIVTLAGFNPQFADRIKRKDVNIIDVKKQPGRDIGCFWRIYKTLKSLNADVLHTRNLTSIEYQFSGWLAGVPLRIHGEHGWDANDLGGKNKKNQTIRRLFRPFIHHYIGLSRESIEYMTDKISISRQNITHICNGVDIDKFKPNKQAKATFGDFSTQNTLLFGTVGRLAEVKNQTLLASAFISLCKRHPSESKDFRLCLVGEGILRPAIEEMCTKANLENQVWLMGDRNDVSALLPAFDVFVLPSLAEGIPNTILEAMACGVPVIATKVGGCPDLIPSQFTQTHLVDTKDPVAMVEAMSQYVANRNKIETDGTIVREHCKTHFSIQGMVNQYHQVYQTYSKRCESCVV